MSEHLVHTLVEMAERGRPRGAETVLSAARRQVEAMPSRRPTGRAVRPVFALATVVIVVLGGLLAMSLLRRDSASVGDGEPGTTTPSTITTLPMSTAVGPADGVADVAVAPDGRLWVATAAGVVVWDLDSTTYTVFAEADGLGGRSVDHLAVAADGTVWAAGNGWLARYDGAWVLVDDEVFAAIDDEVFAAIDDPVGEMAAGPDGAAWFAVGGDALVRIDGDGATIHTVPDDARFATPWARSLAVAPDGTVWASTNMSGVLAFDGAWHRYGVGAGLPSDVVGNISVASDGTVWVGGEGSYGEPDGDVAAAGILRYRDGIWTVFTTADGLLGDDGTVTVDPTGGVWVVHSPLPDAAAEVLGVELADGISRFDGTTWRQYPSLDARGPGAASGDGTLWLPGPAGIVGFDGSSTTTLVVGPDGVPPTAPAGDPVTLERVEDVGSVRLSTSIGEIDLTAWARTEGGDPPWRLTQTGHGVVGDMAPSGTPHWSLDGTTWTPIQLSVEPTGWSDQAAAYGDDLFAFVDGGVGRLTWNGDTWAEAEVLRSARTYRGAAGPTGIVAAGMDQVLYWDGTEFTESSRPPDKTLHPEPSAGCSVPGWASEGIMAELGPVVAADDRFVALAARSEADWYRSPVCEPLVWTSRDGNIWTPTSDESPFGERAFVHDISAVGERLVAVGGVSSTEAAAWVSDDAGLTWQRAEVEAAELWAVAGGARGWVMLGHLHGQGTLGSMWFSTDGLTWDGPHDRPLGWGDRAGMGAAVSMLDDGIVGTGRQFDTQDQAWDSAPQRVIVGVFVDE